MKIYRKNILTIENAEGIPEFYILPAGITLHKYEVGASDEDYFTLVANHKAKDDFSQKVRLPKEGLTKTYLFKQKGSKKEKELRIELIYDNQVLLRCIRLISTEHYKPNIPHGLFIALFHKSEIIGVVIFSKLTYTNPIGRKSFFSQKFKSDEDIKKYALKKIGWINRIVISKKYQSGGYGSFLLEKFSELIMELFSNKELDYIEVLTSWTLADFQKKINRDLKHLKDAHLDEERDFLCRAGFQRAKTDKPIIRSLQRGPGKVEKIIQYYYVKKFSK